VIDVYLHTDGLFNLFLANPMKTFLFLVRKANLEGKLAGAFGSYVHSGDAPALIFDTMLRPTSKQSICAARESRWKMLLLRALKAGSGMNA
jgi:hypothetical protein